MFDRIERRGQECLHSARNLFSQMQEWKFALGTPGMPTQYLRGETSGIENRYIQAFAKTPTGDFINYTLIPGGCAVSDRGSPDHIERIKAVVGSWERRRTPGRDEPSLRRALAYYSDKSLFPMEEDSLVMVLAHTTPFAGLVQSLNYIRPDSRTQKDEWLAGRLKAAERFAGAVYQKVSYAKAHGDRATLRQAYQSLFTENGAVGLILLLDGIIGSETVDIQRDLARATLLATPKGGETGPDYDLRILIGAMLHPSDNNAYRAAIELGRRLNNDGYPHIPIYRLLGQVPMDNRHFPLWNNFYMAQTQISRPDYQKEMFEFLADKMTSEIEHKDFSGPVAGTALCNMQTIFNHVNRVKPGDRPLVIPAEVAQKVIQLADSLCARKDMRNEDIERARDFQAEMKEMYPELQSAPTPPPSA